MSKVISGAGAECVSWELPEVTHGGQPTHSTAGTYATAGQLEKLQQQAYAEGFERGRRDGMAAASEQARRLAALCERLAHPLEELDEAVVSETARLALVIARHLVRRELKADPAQVVAVVQQAMAALPVAARKIRLYLHPEDAALVRAALEDEAAAWTLCEDPLMGRGDCRVVSEHSQIDATVERRLGAIAAQMFGGERLGDEAGE